jgi:uncharacterized membrane protein
VSESQTATSDVEHAESPAVVHEASGPRAVLVRARRAAVSDPRTLPTRFRAWRAGYPAFTVAAIAALTVSSAASGLLLFKLLTLAFLLLVPGSMLLDAISPAIEDTSKRFVYSIAASVTFLMVVGLAVDVALPSVGVHEPLRQAPLLLGCDVALAGLGALCALLGRTPTRPWPSAAFRPVYLAWAALPLLACWGAQLLNGSGTASELADAVAVLELLLLVGLLVTADRLPTGHVAAGLVSLGLALQYSYSLRSAYVFGFDIQTEYRTFTVVDQAGRWHPGSAGNIYNAMLSVTILPSELTRLTAISGIYVFKLVYPLLYALMPVCAYLLVRRFLPAAGQRVALAATVPIFVQQAFFQEMPAVTRQEVGLLMFATLMLAMFDGPSVRGRRLLSAVFATGMVLGHYSTAYAALAAFGLAALVTLITMAVRRKWIRHAVSFAVLAWTAALAGVWYIPLTHSTGNLSLFADRVTAPSLSGTVTGLVSGGPATTLPTSTYMADVNAEYQNLTYLQHYPPSGIAAASREVAASTAPVVKGLVPALGGVANSGDTLLQLALTAALAASGLALVCWSLRRRGRPELAEYAAVAVVMVVFLAEARVSTSFAASYNPERMLQQGSIVLGVGFAGLLMALRRVRLVRRAVIPVLGAAFTLLLSNALGTTAAVTGGAADTNLHDYGENYERYYVTAPDVAAAQWLGSARTDNVVVFSDRYGALDLAAYTDIAGGLFTDITPMTLDPGGYVLVTTANTVYGRNRGAYDNEVAVFTYPLAAIDAEQNLLMSAGGARVYGPATYPQ